MTRRICSGCGHAIVAPAGGDVDGVMGDHMAEHAAQHVKRGELAVWVVDAVLDEIPWRRLLLEAAAAGAVVTAGVAIVLGTATALGWLTW